MKKMFMCQWLDKKKLLVPVAGFFCSSQNGWNLISV